MNNEAFNKLANRTIYLDLSELARKKSNLFNSLTKAEKLELQNGFKNTDLIVITSKIDSRNVEKINGSGSISVSGNIIVFDLRTGEFVGLVSDKVKNKFDEMESASPPLDQLVNSLLSGLSQAIEN